ncbi:synaptotagmin-like protein 2 isoform X3 [Microcaecilia unicolor]|uniref:Synaptotagmin-like protein 2 n=1 Tax=Microcaecilia unicolor TaxID=1415580 RepID=A0A6P7XZ03_9AMPH|nr:synaptotagmin-like protein 2 isoform X3 [Microcaecilia unicolor]
MIDLSFLTEEEQEAIMKVLSRDAELKRSEEERIRQLEETVDDNSMLKNMSGQWFYDAKSKRHSDKIHGADLIRASIRKKKPQTIAELSQSKADKNKKSWVNNVNRDIFVPPELFGVIEEPEKEEEEELKQTPSYHSASKVNALSKEKPKETFITVSSPGKQRKNPFNDSTLLEESFALKPENLISENGTVHLHETPEENTLSSSLENVTSKNVQNSESKKSKNSRSVANGLQRSSGQPPVPKARTMTYQIMDAQLNCDSTFPKTAKRNDLNNGTGTRKGILKRSSSSSSTDSEILRIGQNFDTQNKTLPTSPILDGVIEKNSGVEQSEESSQNGLDKLKHVRFSSNVSQKALSQAPELRKGKELGEYDLLDSDLSKNGPHGLKENQNEPGGSKSSFVSQPLYSTTDAQTTVNVPDDGHGLTKDILLSSVQSSSVKSAVDVSEEKSEFSNQSLERDPKSVTHIPQDYRFSKYSVPSESSSSAINAQSAADVSQQEQFPSSSSTNHPHLSISENSQQERRSEEASERTNSNEISANTNKVSIETLPEREPAQLLDLDTQTTKFSVDQQPIYAEINKTPQVSKPNPADLQQDQQPIYPVINSPQMPKPNPTDLQQDTETEDQNIQPTYLDQKLKNQDMVHGREHLLFVKNKGGEDKTYFNATNKLQEPNNINREADLKSFKERTTMNVQPYEDFLKEPDLEGTTNIIETSKEKIGLDGHREAVEKQPDAQDQEDMQIGIATWRRPRILEQSEFMQPFEPVEPSQEKRRVSDMKSIWEEGRDSTTTTTANRDSNYKEYSSFAKQKPNQVNNQKSIDTNSEYCPTEPRDPSKYNLVAFKRVEIQDEEQPPSSITYLKSLWEKDEMEKNTIPDKPRLDYTTDKSGKTMVFVGKNPKEFVGSPTTEDFQLKKKSNIAGMSKNFEKRNESHSPLKTDKTYALLQKANFSVLSLKERLNEDPKDHVSNPYQFQSLRNFWNVGNKSQDKMDVKPSVIHSPSVNNSIPSDIQTKSELMEAKETIPENVQARLESQGQNQLLNIQERRLPREEKYQSSSKKTMQPDHIAPVESKKKDHSSKEAVQTEEKYISHPKTDDNAYDTGLEKLCQEAQKNRDTMYQPINAKGKSNDNNSRQPWHTSENMMNLNQIVSTDVHKEVESPRKEVAETVEKATAPSKADLNLFNVALEKLEREATEISNYNILSKEPSQTEQRKFFEKVMERSHNESFDFQKEKQACPSEVRETVLKTAVPLKTDLTKFNVSLEKLHKEASETPSPLNLAAVGDSKGQENVSRTEQQCSFEKEMQSNHNCSTDPLRNVVEGSTKQKIETVEKTMALPKTEHNTGIKNAFKEVSEPSHASCQNIAGNQISSSRASQPEERGDSEKMSCLKEYQKERAYSQEVREVIEKTISAPKTDVNNFEICLAKLQKEASELSSPLDQGTVAKLPSEKYSPPDQEHYFKKAIDCNPNYSINCQIENEAHPEEVEVSIEKTVALSKPGINEFKISLEKLCEEVARAPSPLNLTTTEECKIQKNVFGHKMESSDKMIQSSHSTAADIPKKREYPVEVTETVKKTIAPEKAEQSIFNIGLENLRKEASEMSPKLDKTSANREDMYANIPGPDEQENITPSDENSRKMYHPEETRISVKSIEFDQKDSLGYQQKIDLPQEVNESVEKMVAPPNAESRAFKTNLEKLYQEVVKGASPPYQRTDDTFPPDPNSEPQQGPFIPNITPTNLNSSQSLLQVMAPVPKDSMRQNDEKDKEQSVIGDFVASDTTVPKVQKTPLHANVESVEIPVMPGEKNELISKVVEEEKTFEHEHIDSSFDSDKEVVGSDVHEHKTEGNVSSIYVTESTPLKDAASSIKRSTIELYLASPYQEDEDLAKFDDSNLLVGNTGSCSSNGRTSSRSEEELNIILSALKRSTAKSMPSKSLEDIPSVTSNQRKVDLPKEELVLSDEDVSTVPSFPDNQFSNAEKLKRLSQSVPALLQEESDDRETDSTSESSFQLGRHKKSPSSLTNLSGSSGMASMSSVSGSVMSIYSGDFGNVDVKGNIQFAIDYVEQLREFHVFVAQCKDLAVADVKKQRSDPYVKSYLLPDKAKMGKRKTAVRKKTLNPAYNEILRYKIDKKTLLTQKLNLSVWHNDTFGRNSFLGEVELDLATWNWNNKQMNWFPLKPRTPAAGLAIENRGEIKLALKYVPQPSTGKKALETGEVHIWVKECRGLPLLRGNRINSFVKCTILPDTSRKSRQKTRSVEKTTDPVFNHTMVYDGFRSEDLKEACIELTVWDHNKLANHFLGGLRIGLGTGKSYGTLVDWMDSTIDEVSLWERMIRSPNEWVEDTLPLRMLMLAKMAK